MENTKDVKRLEMSVAVLLTFTPIILRLKDGYFRESISDYAYSDYPCLLPFLLTLAGAMFLWNGLGNKRHLYNVVLGVSLFGIALTPHLDYPILHYLFAGTFFIGSIAAIFLSSNIAFRGFKILLSSIIILALLSHFIFDLFSLLTAESIGIIPIASHFFIKTIYSLK